MSFLYRPKLPPLWPTTIRTVQLLAAWHFASTYIAEFRICSGFSMLPTLSHQGDCVLVSPIPYWAPFFGGRPERGDVVVATSPMDPDASVCKRVVGIEGDIIEVEPRRGGKRKWIGEEDRVFGDSSDTHTSQDLNVPEVARYHDSEGRPLGSKRKGEGSWVKIPKGYVWLAGDNMSNSTDSRMYGPVPLAIVKGKVIARVYPNFKWMNNPVRELDANERS